MRLAASVAIAAFGLAVASTAGATGPAPAAKPAPPDAAAPAEEAGTETPTEPSPAEPGAAPQPAAPQPTAEASPDEPARSFPASVVGPEIVDTVLPCGLRVIAAEDSTLPVAAVILAVETGSEDDPEELPGLTHALAYQLLQGNRDLGPGSVARMANDSGGVAMLGTGPAQIRFESLVPVSMLDDLLAAESQRLRAPTVDEHLWNDALTWARRDAARTWSLPRKALAEVHRTPGLAHDGRKVSAALVAMKPREVSAALADRFGYDRSTLIVVAPAPPLATLAKVQPLFAELPSRPRSIPRREAAAAAETEPRPVEVEAGDGRVLAWPIAPGPGNLEWARVWCRTFNRQRRAKDEPRRARVRCQLDKDPRRATLVVRALGTEDPPGLIAARIARMDAGERRSMLARQSRAVRDALELRLRGALPLARSLASAAPRADGDDSVTRGLHLLTGLASLREPQAGAPELARILDLGRAILLVPPASAP